MKFFLIAGERSGDLHGSFLIKAIKEQNPEAELIGYGGNLMNAEGMKLLSHYNDISFMGFWEVLKNMPIIFRKIHECEEAIRKNKPDVIILIDFPGFNLRMAKYAKKQGIKVVYYISPKVWAWKEGRVRQIKNNVDRLYSILPFEVPFYNSHELMVHYVGNPVVEELNHHKFAELPVADQEGVKVAYLPGSRVQEVMSSVEMIGKCALLRPDYQFLVAGVENIPPSLYEPLGDLDNVHVVIGKTYEVIRACDAAIVTSGTATLETALLNTPQVVCYRTSTITYWIARAFIKVKYVSLVNLIQDERIVHERLQQEYKAEIILDDIDALLNSPGRRNEMLSKYDELRKTLGSKSASKTLASDLTGWLNERAI